MELWIRSQDKTIFEKVSTIQLCENPDRSWFFNTDLGLILGKYKTQERALEVLDEIQKIIGWLQKDMKNVTVGDFKSLIGSFNNYVYEMPKE